MRRPHSHRSTVSKIFVLYKIIMTNPLVIILLLCAESCVQKRVGRVWNLAILLFHKVSIFKLSKSCTFFCPLVVLTLADIADVGRLPKFQDGGHHTGSSNNLNSAMCEVGQSWLATFGCVIDGWARVEKVGVAVGIASAISFLFRSNFHFRVVATILNFG